MHSLPVQLRNLIGTQAFLPDLLAHIRNASTASIPLDPVIFQSILLCLIADDKHLILRTPEEDVGLTVNLVVWTLSSIFNMPTRKLKARPRNAANRPIGKSSNSTCDPAAVFLRSLFLPSPSSDSSSIQTSQDDQAYGEGSASDHAKHSKHHRRSRTPNQASSSSSAARSRPASEYARARSYPSNVGTGNAFASIVRTASPGSMLMQSSFSPSVYHDHHESGAIPNPVPPIVSTGILKPTPIYPSNHSTSPGLPHAFTDPLPLPRRKHISGSHLSYAKRPELPHALVVSELENATDAVHKAFAKVLMERKVVLKGHDDPDAEDDTWPLPDDFIAVYVCPWNARERPMIHKALLDKFAMSTNVLISQNVRRDFNLLMFPPSTISRPFLSNDFSHSNPNSPSSTHPMPLPQTQTYTPPTFTKPLPLHRPHPSSSTTLSARSQAAKPIEPLIHPSLIQTLRAVHGQVHLASNLLLYMSDIFSAARHCPRLDGMLLTARSIMDAQDLVKAARVLGSDLTGGELLRPNVGLGDGDSGGDSDPGTEDESYQERGDTAFDENAIYHDARSTFDLGEERQELLGSQKGDEAASVANTSPLHAAAAVKFPCALDVSEVHVARIVPRVISHRVRVRDGPKDEVLASALFGATFGPSSRKVAGEDAQTNEDGVADQKSISVKSLLVQILAEV